MKKLICLALLIFTQEINAQNPTYQQKLFYTCKVWGFVKYFHSGVSTCQVNWDSVLLSRLPHIKTAVTKNDFNSELDTLLLAAGPMTIVPGTLPDTLPAELKRNRNFSWLSDTIFRADVRTILDTIKNNFRPHASCWVKNNPYTNSYTGWLLFPHDSLMINSDTYTAYPNEYTRLLVGFKHWNIINYFNPYNYVLDKPIDSTLYNKILLIANAANYQSFYLAVKKITVDFDDAHVQGLTASTHVSAPTYYYAPEIILTYTQNKYIVAGTTLPSIARGDAIVSINGITASAMENNLRPYISAGNSAVFRRFMCQYLLNGYANTAATIVYSDSAGVNHTLNATRTTYIYDNFFYTYYPNDTLANVTWKQLTCGVGYVNMGLLQTTDVNAMYSALHNAPAIIFDIRNYPNNTAWPIANKMYANKRVFSKLTIPDVTYPGTYYYDYDYLGVNGNPTPYTGKVIILMNEQTQSQAEFSCMILGSMPNALKVGSQTAGTDGNITYFNLSKDIQSGFTTLGVYYPNGDSTERIGIVLDSLVNPTPLGIRHHRDEVLEKALEIANCNLASVQNTDQPVSNICIYPNPASGNFTMVTNAASKQTMQIIDINGRIVLTQSITGSANINAASLNEGVYNISIFSAEGIFNKRLIIVK